MAIRKIGKQYYVYYVENGHQIALNVGDSEETAKIRDRMIMELRKRERNDSRFRKTMERLNIRQDFGTFGNIRQNPSTFCDIRQDSARFGESREIQTIPGYVEDFSRHSVLLSDFPKMASKRRNLDKRHHSEWERMLNATGLKLPEHLTSKVAIDYMDSMYGNSSPKTFNNVLGKLRVVFRCAMAEAGISLNPFDSIPQKSLRGKVEHYRPFTDKEVRLILDKCGSEYWKCLFIIAINTGMRLESCKRLSPSMIKDGIIEIVPGKTARFGRAVRIPLTRELKEYLEGVKVSDFMPFCSAYRNIRKYPGTVSPYFTTFLDAIGIVGNNDGQVGFHSTRDYFITKMRGAGMNEEALRGIVGHADSGMTDLYSRDTEMARKEIERIGGTPVV